MHENNIQVSDDAVQVSGLSDSTYSVDVVCVRFLSLNIRAIDSRACPTLQLPSSQHPCANKRLSEAPVRMVIFVLSSAVCPSRTFSIENRSSLCQAL